LENSVHRILEAGIAGYTQQEPLAGLPDRILSRIALTQPAPPRKTWHAALAISSAAVIILNFFLWPRPRAIENAHPAVSIVAAQPVIKPEPTSLRTSPKHSPTHHAKSLPKLPVFPTPTPLTNEERRLVAFVEKDPQGAAETFKSFRKQSEPLQIEDLKIQPLDTSEGQ
jgi:hypothetical protein